MALEKPFKRTVRQLSIKNYKGGYGTNLSSAYIFHPDYAKSPERFIRAYLLIIKDIEELFEYVEPTDENKRTHSYRIHSIFLRVCIEVEANFRAILSENSYSKKPDNYNMKDYQLVDYTHKLSDYVVKIPRWNGNYDVYKPFGRWKEGKNLKWYWYYNEVKHNMHENFRHANIKNLIEAASGLTALICSQFLDEDFSPNEGSILTSGENDGFQRTVGGMYRVMYPDWKEPDWYGFEWDKIRNKNDIFDKHNYDEIKENHRN